MTDEELEAYALDIGKRVIEIARKQHVRGNGYWNERLLNRDDENSINQYNPDYKGIVLQPVGALEHFTNYIFEVGRRYEKEDEKKWRTVR